jgi:hypothetical protein
VSVPPDPQDAQQFWFAVLDAIRQTDAIANVPRQAAALDFDGKVIVHTVVSEMTKAAGLVVGHRPALGTPGQAEVIPEG